MGTMSFGRKNTISEFLIYNIIEVIKQTLKYVLFHNWVNKLFSEENKVLRTLFEARKVAGSATSKQSKTAWKCLVF